jgi:hypothetical protein
MTTEQMDAVDDIINLERARAEAEFWRKKAELLSQALRASLSHLDCGAYLRGIFQQAVDEFDDAISEQETT